MCLLRGNRLCDMQPRFKIAFKVCHLLFVTFLFSGIFFTLHATPHRLTIELASRYFTTIFARHHKLLANSSTTHASHKLIAIASVHQFHGARISCAVHMRNMAIFASIKDFEISSTSCFGSLARLITVGMRVIHMIHYTWIDQTH
jgi:hypothetical protein